MGRAKWQIIGRGWVGWHAAAVNVSSSGGQLEPYAYGSTPCAGYAAEAEDGALVYDASEAERDAFARLIIAGPMPTPGLESGMMVRGFGSGPQPWDGEIHGLDRVALDVYERLLRQVPGVKFARVRGGQVQWEESAHA
jgi:hypothetical protein